ncbi:MAG: amidase [Acidimicrobiaceae bacterium]|nr:amidase [Acidimicrobiaceae bacterium]
METKITDRIVGILKHIHNQNPKFGAFVDILDSRAEQEAREMDKSVAQGNDLGGLAGIAVGVKELFDVAGADNSYGSLTRDGFIAKNDAEIVKRLRKAGAIIVGTTRSHEFGWGITTQHATRGSTLNPWDLSKVPGGSSGGSAAAVSAGLVPLAVGSDTGGSIRIPAAFCGVLGLKTTWGRITRDGGVSLAPSFDSPGFFARSTKILSAAFFATAGKDWNDSATLSTPEVGHMKVTDRDLRTFSFGISDVENSIPLNRERETAFINLCEVLRSIGAAVIEVPAPNPKISLAAFVPYQMAEAFHIHTQILKTYPEKAELYGDDVRARLELASKVTATQYIEARRSASDIYRQFLKVFTTVDVLLTVVGSTGPSSISDPDFVVINGDRQPLRNSVMPSTVPQNLAGLPSITFPFGFDDGLPIGIQMTGPPFSETLLLHISSAMEEAGIIRIPNPPISPVTQLTS